NHIMKTIKSLFNVLLCFIPFLLSAQTPTIHSSEKPDWIVKPALSDYTPSVRDIKNGYFLSEKEQQYHLEKQAKYTRIIRGIVSDAGIQNGSEISVSFDPTYETLTFHQITVWRNKKPLNRLQLSKFKIIADEEDLSNFIYQGTYNAYLILDDIRKGDRIEYSYTISGENPIFKNKFANSLYLQEYEPVSHYYTCLIASPSRKLNFKYLNGAPKGKIITQNNLLRYEWESSKLKAIEYEDDTPAWFYSCPTVQVSEYATWAEVAKWANEINPASANMGGEASVFVDGLKDKFKNDKQAQFRAAVKFVQNEVRYMGVENGEYSHRAGNPEKVFTQRYGDCKDKALLLVSLLRSLDIKANIALVNTTEKEHIQNHLPSPVSFDHAVVCATVNNKKVWIDATMQYQGGVGANIYFPDYRKALIVGADTKELTNIPKSKTGVFTVFERFTMTDQNSPVELKVRTVYTHDGADDLRSSLASNSINEREKDYLKYYEKLYSKVKALDTIVVLDDPVKNEIVTIERYSISKFFKQDSISGTHKASFYSEYVNNILPTIAGERKQPLWLNSSKAISHTITIVMPGGWSVDTENKDIKTDEFKFHSYYTSLNDTLTLSYDFEFLKDFVPASKSAKFAEQIKQLDGTVLGYDIVYTPDDVPFYPNYRLMAYSVIFLISLIVAAYFKYNQVTSTSIYHKVPMEIGGWLIVIMLVLAITFLREIKDIIDEKYLDLNKWDFHSARESNTFYKLLLTVRVFSKLYVVIFAAFCLVLMIAKRDILPKTISIYIASASVLSVIQYILATRLYGEDSSSFSNVMYFVITSFVMIYYFKTSERVKDTFVVAVKSKKSELDN
ncbi:MAG: hypothetical protein JWQ25_644, partial [Daejeonella sp.]|nr:hypothetical protein [Daejeonella sp.]